MNLVGSLTQAVGVLVETSTSLPSVRLVVLDDWCAESGRIPAARIKDAGALADALNPDITLLLISKAGIDASNKAASMNVRGRKGMIECGFQVWTLERPADGPVRNITVGDDLQVCRIDESGFVEN